MKLQIFYMVAFFFAIQNSVAQNGISGNIKDEQTNETIIGAAIYINDLKFGTATDSEGNYALENIRTGTYLFEVSFIGYKSITSRIYIHQDTVVNFKLSESATELSEIVVTGVSRSTELKQSPVIIKPIDI